MASWAKRNVWYVIGTGNIATSIYFLVEVAQYKKSTYLIKWIAADHVVVYYALNELSQFLQRSSVGLNEINETDHQARSARQILMLPGTINSPEFQPELQHFQAAPITRPVRCRRETSAP